METKTFDRWGGGDIKQNNKLIQTIKVLTFRVIQTTDLSDVKEVEKNMTLHVFRNSVTKTLRK